MKALQQARSGDVIPARGPVMSTFGLVPLLATLGLVVGPAMTEAAWGDEFECRREDQVRRVELRLADDQDQLPCAVIYWLDTEAPGQPQTLWNAQHQLDYCRDKAELMVERLKGSGWTCAGAATDAMAATTVEEAQSPAPVVADVRASPRNPEVADARGQPDETMLRAALDRDIRRLEELTAGASGGFTTEAATLGDLNGDGIQDAAVLLTHRAEGEEPTHYLLAYLYVGATFQPVARVNLEAFYQNFAEVRIAAVAKGAVELLLHVPRAADPACCPSGRRQATFGLQNREFVLLKEIDLGA